MAQAHKQDESSSSTHKLEREAEEQKLATTSLRFAVSEWRATFDAIADPVFILDVDGTILRCNKAMAKFLSKPMEDILGKTCWELIHGFVTPVDGCPVARMIKSLKRETKVLPFGDKWLEITSDPILDDTGKLVRAVHIISDITEKMRTEEELQKSVAILDAMGDVVIATTIDGIITKVNAAFTELYGYTSREIIGRSVFVCFPETEHPAHRKEIETALKTNTRRTLRAIALAKTGLKIPVELHSAVQRDQHGRPLGLVAVLRDISAQKNAEEKMKASLRDKEVLLKEVHHRVKNNMAVVAGLVGLQATTIKEKDISIIFQELRNRILSMSLIHELLYESTSLVAIDLDPYLTKLTNILMRTYLCDHRRISIVLNVKGVSLNINQAVPFALVVNELLSNSFKYAFPGANTGKIEINARYLDGDKVKVIVSDDGLGIPENLDLDNTNKLGLSLVKNLVTKQLNGQLEFTSKGGTQFTITFQRS